MNRTTVMDPGADPESVINQELGDVGEYVREREKIQDRDVLAALREMDSFDTTRWAVHRVGAIDQNQNGWLGDLEPEMLTVQNIANTWGPGTYRVAGKYSNGQYAAQRTIRIAGDATRATSSPAQAPMQHTNSFDEWERRQEARDERRRKERNELLAILVPALAPLGAALVGAMTNRGGTDIAALITALKPPDPMTLIAALKQLQPDVQANQPTALDQALKLIDKFRDMAPAEGGTNWMDIGKEAIRTLGPVVGPALESAIVRAQNNSVNATSLARSNTSVPIVNAPVALHAENLSENPQMFGMLALLPWLKTQLNMALRKASGGGDPGLVAEWILSELPEGIEPESLIEFIQRPDWWQQIQKFDPRVTPYGPWFTQMRQALIEQVQGPDESSRTETPAMSVKQIDDDSIDRPSGEPPKLGA